MFSVVRHPPGRAWWNSRDAFAFFLLSSKSRRVWKVLFWHVTHALSGFSRLSHKNVLSSTIEKREKKKKLSQASLDRRFFQILTFIVIHSSSDVKKRTSIKLFCAVSLAVFFMRIKRIIRISIIFFIVYQRTSTQQHPKAEKRRLVSTKNSLHDNVTQCDAGTRQKNQDIIIFLRMMKSRKSGRNKK